MIYKKKTIVYVKHKRFGGFIGIVGKEFDTDKEEFFPIKVFQEDPVKGLSNTFEKGDKIPCRNTFVELIVIEERDQDKGDWKK